MKQIRQYRIGRFGLSCSGWDRAKDRLLMCPILENVHFKCTFAGICLFYVPPFSDAATASCFPGTATVERHHGAFPWICYYRRGGADMRAAVFRRLRRGEFEDGYSIICEVTDWLLSKGSDQWLHPILKQVHAERQEQGFNYGLWLNGVLAAVVSLTNERPDQ